MVTAKGYLLAMPRGGFNDTLCQLERCARHAAATGRRLIVDTRLSGMGADLFDYFDLGPDQAGMIVKASDWPGGVRIEGGRIALDLDGQRHEWILPAGDPSLPLDFTAASDAPVLLHHGAGGGGLGVFFLSRLRLKPALAETIATRLRAIGPGYVAVHIRHTDSRSDYVTAFARIVARNRGRRLLICSDSEAPIAHFRATWGNVVRWETTDSLRSADLTPLHERGPDGAAARNGEMLSDLYLLAAGSRMVMVDTLDGRRSGFALLAAHMCRRLEFDGSAGSLRLRPRLGPYLRAMARGNLFRVWRLRHLLDDPARPLILHPTVE